jgi:hypothetical protein
MKIRKGFVSNSSTSSFLIVGFPVTELTKEQLEIEGMEKLSVWEDDDSCSYFGIGWSSDENDASEIPLNFILESMKIVEEKIGKKPKIYSWGVHQT